MLKKDFRRLPRRVLLLLKEDTQIAWTSAMAMEIGKGRFRIYF